MRCDSEHRAEGEETASQCTYNYSFRVSMSQSHKLSFVRREFEGNDTSDMTCAAGHMALEWKTETGTDVLFILINGSATNATKDWISVFDGLGHFL